MSELSGGGATARPFIIAGLATSSLGLVLLLALEFGGWTVREEYTEGSYRYTDYYVALWSENVPGYVYPLILLLAAGLAYPAYVAAAALRRRHDPDRRRLTGAYLVAGTTAAATVLAAIAFVVLASDAFEWWLGAGFYGAVSGAALTAFLLRRARDLYPAR